MWEQSRRPELAPLTEALQAGRISLPVGARLGSDLALLAVSIPSDWWAAAAGELIAYAAGGASTSQLASVREALIASYGTDNDFEAQQEDLHHQRCFTTPVKNAAGLWVGSYAMSNDDHAALTAALDALAAPCRTADGQRDDRTRGQRNLDAIIEMCRVVGTDPTLLRHTRPASAAKAQVIITLDYDTITLDYDTLSTRAATSSPGSVNPAGRGYGVDGHGHPVTPATARRLACDALLIPAVLGGDGAILDLGRAARFASSDQVRYLRLRDQGCTYPGCDRPPSWCDAHHPREWAADHGETNVDQLALLCTRHHTDVHRHHLTGELHDGTIRWRPRE